MKINPVDHAIKLTTTLNRLKLAGACRDRYEHLVKALGGISFDHEAPINLLKILDTNGVDDCLWALCATAENCDTVAQLMAADFAEAVLPIYEQEYPNDKRARKVIKATRQYAVEEIGEAAWEAARVAAWAAAWAAREAAQAAAGEAAWVAAAAGAAARAAAGEAAWAAGAAGAVAWAAARAAARAAAGEAAGAAAWAAARAAAGEAARAAGAAARAAAGAADQTNQVAIIKRYLLP